MRRILFVILLALPVLASGCTTTTALRFINETECGTATIQLTNKETGSLVEYTVPQGKEVEAKISPNVEYHYEVDYERQPGDITCDSKKVTTELTKGKTLNIRLTSVRDASLLTPTPEPTSVPGS